MKVLGMRREFLDSLSWLLKVNTFKRRHILEDKKNIDLKYFAFK